MDGWIGLDWIDEWRVHTLHSRQLRTAHVLTRRRDCRNIPPEQKNLCVRVYVCVWLSVCVFVFMRMYVCTGVCLNVYGFRVCVFIQLALEIKNIGVSERISHNYSLLTT